uniref:Uncharacterized protein n=1 Tax=Anser cygnoides TaxID=8845 RepID=A0A8B9EMY1_ANSCY
MPHPVSCRVPCRAVPRVPRPVSCHIPCRVMSVPCRAVPRAVPCPVPGRAVPCRAVPRAVRRCPVPGRGRSPARVAQGPGQGSGLYKSSAGRGRCEGSAMKPGSLLPLLSLVLLVALLAPRGECRPDSELVLAGKLGQCPAPRRTPGSSCGYFCSTDDNCPGSERCCSNGCGQECRLPIGGKPGFCPRLDPDMMTICLVECGSDSDCKGNEKCCSMGCHVHCVRPVPAKPGVCPKRKVLQTLVACNNTCSDDTDCPGSNKCCFTGCSRGCVPPARRSSYNPAAVLLGWGWGCRQCPALVASPVLQSDICHLPPEHGPCRGHFYRYAYNPATGTCRVFLYGGCRGNANNFETLKECQRACQRGRATE